MKSYVQYNTYTLEQVQEVKLKQVDSIDSYFRKDLVDFFAMIIVAWHRQKNKGLASTSTFPEVTSALS